MNFWHDGKRVDACATRCEICLEQHIIDESRELRIHYGHLETACRQPI